MRRFAPGKRNLRRRVHAAFLSAVFAEVLGSQHRKPSLRPSPCLLLPLPGIECDSDPGLEPRHGGLQPFQVPQLINQSGIIGKHADTGQGPGQVPDSNLIRNFSRHRLPTAFHGPSLPRGSDIFSEVTVTYMPVTAGGTSERITLEQ